MRILHRLKYPLGFSDNPDDNGELRQKCDSLPVAQCISEWLDNEKSAFVNLFRIICALADFPENARCGPM